MDIGLMDYNNYEFHFQYIFLFLRGIIDKDIGQSRHTPQLFFYFYFQNDPSFGNFSSLLTASSKKFLFSWISCIIPRINMFSDMSKRVKPIDESNKFI